MVIGPGYPGYPVDVRPGSITAPWLKTVDSEERCNTDCRAALFGCGENRPEHCDPRRSICESRSDATGVCTCCNEDRATSPMVKELCDEFCEGTPERRGTKTFGDETFTCPPPIGTAPAETGPAPHQFTSITPRLEIPLPTLPSLSQFTDVTIQGDAPNRYLLIPWLGQYIAAIYKYAIGIVGILSGIMIVIGGLLWLTAGGDAGKVSTAKSFIESSLVGLVIALTSYLLLYAINPKLTEFDSLRVNYIERVPLTSATPGTQHTDEEEEQSPEQNTSGTPGGLLAGATPQATCRAKILGFGNNGIPEAGIPKADVVKINLSEFPGLNTTPPAGVGGGPQYFLVNKQFEQKMREALQAAARAGLRIYRVGSLRSGDSFRASNLGDPHNFGLAWDVNVPTSPWCPFRAANPLDAYNAWSTSDALRVKCARADPNLASDNEALARIFSSHSIDWYGRRGSDTKSVACVKIVSESPFQFYVASKQNNTHSAPGNLLPPNIKLTDGDRACTDAGYPGYKLVPHLDLMHFQVADVWTWISNLPGYRECVRDLSQ
ncbi:pilin [Patescibacteria group bacterium]|nr:pilin [Patescibacteria group bacterium]